MYIPVIKYSGRKYCESEEKISTFVFQGFLHVVIVEISATVASRTNTFKAYVSGVDFDSTNEF